MDGNRRWAKQRGLLPWLGHREGIKALERTVQFCVDNRISYLSLYTFSIENFGRSDQEKNFLFIVLFNETKERLLKSMLEKNVRVRFIGDRSLFPSSMIAGCTDIENRTMHCTGLIVNMLFCYGGRQEIVSAVKDIVASIQAGAINITDIDENYVYKKLWLGDVPEPELMIRTGGAQRLSNFLLYQTAYTDFYFLDCLWPDINETHLHAALDYVKSCRKNKGL